MIAVDAARGAVERGDWAHALELLSAPEVDQDPEALELRAAAAYGAGDLEGAVTAWERVHALRVAAGDDSRAAWAAGMIAMYLLIDTGLMAPVRGWVRRADRLLEDTVEAPAHALVAMVRTYERFMSGDARAANEQAELAMELGERQGVLPAVILGQVASARLLISDGAVAEGLERLDEVAVRLMSGDVDPLTTGMMYCELICAAQWLGEHDRARDWTEVMERWRHGVAFGALNGRCRVHRAEILRVTGTCAEAEQEALAACEELRPWLRREYGWPLVELGNIRLRKGDLDGAEEAFLSAHDHSWSPQPGLALLRLAQGDVAAATSLIADAIEHPVDMPSKELPPFGDLRLAPLLDAQAEIAAYADDAATATRATEALAEIAGRYPSSGLAAATRVARARRALLSGDLTAAINEAAAGVAAWADVGAPYETAVARMLLGRAYEAAGQMDRAGMEWQAANVAFRDFGAVGRVSEVEGLLSGRAARVRASHPEREDAVATFLRSGGSRTVAFRGRSVVLPDLKGFRYLDRLLAEPGREFHVCDMVAGEHGTTAAAESGLPVLDDEAKAAYRRRLADVDEDIEEATLMNDLGRLELAERDRDYLVAELARAAGIGGRDRTLGGSAERARTSVARSLRYAIQRLAEHDEVLAGYLTQTIRTGTYCSYAPDPVAAVAWELRPQPGVRNALR